MKQIVTLILILFFNSSFAQTKFFDGNDKEITEDEFNNKELESSAFKVFNDSLKTAKIIIDRTEKGETNSDSINGILIKDLGLKLNPSKPTVIVFYPGKDKCNSGSTQTPESSYKWYKEMEKGAKKIIHPNFIYVFKNNDGLKTLDKLPWRKDPGSLIENTFFKYHYPCLSYVIVYKNKYISYFGEFTRDSVWEDLKEITNKKSAAKK